MCKMHPNLVGPSGMNTNGQQGKTRSGVPIQRTPFAVCGLAAPVFWNDGHAGFQRGVPSQRKAAFAPFRRKSMRDCQVGFGYFPIGEGPRQFKSCAFVQRHDQKAGSVLIQSMNYARPFSFQLCQFRHAGKQTLYQRPLGAARTGVNREVGRLVDDNQMFVAIQNIQLALFRYQSGCVFRGKKEQFCPGGKAYIRLETEFAVYLAVPFFHGALDLGTGKPEPCAQEGVQTLPPFLGGDGKTRRRFRGFFPCLPAGVHAAGLGVMT